MSTSRLDCTMSKMTAIITKHYYIAFKAARLKPPRLKIATVKDMLANISINICKLKGRSIPDTLIKNSTKIRKTKAFL